MLWEMEELQCREIWCGEICFRGVSVWGSYIEGELHFGSLAVWWSCSVGSVVWSSCVVG